tara:strand:+ start:3459 stop:6092 length:2634 start_codon:yes stop_codon:yes gene_type:complete
MAKRSYFPVKIPINTLSGGVGRNAPTKRLPSEVQDMTNMFCTTERSIDKRNGFYALEGGGLDLGFTDVEEKDIWFNWFFVGDTQRYLVAIDSAASREEFLKVYKINTANNTLEHQAVDTNIPSAIRNYIKHGGNSRSSLRAVSVGTSLLILNTEVKAGFTSDGIDDLMFGLDGIKKDQSDPTALDVKGRKIEYQTSITVDAENQAEIWTASTDYVWGQTAIDTTDVNSSDSTRYGIYKVKQSLAADALPGPTYATGTPTAPSADTAKWEKDKDDDNNHRYSSYIPAEDYVYPDPTKKYLGQAITKFSDLRFPPDSTDVTAWNGDSRVTSAIKNLYPTSGDSIGRGKIIYLSQAYLGSAPGWYRMINTTDKPYLEHIRTPDEMNLIDQKRMPVQLYLDETENHWSIRFIDWEPRKSGTKVTNPGPSFFQDKDGNAQQKEIKAISFYRDRLFLATDDTLVSSRLGKFDDLFISDPANITVIDPIDLNVSSNIYTPITFLQPFKDFLFLGTSGDTQYELMGSENQISPLTAEIAPTSFFPMTSDIEPITMNNNLFFFSKNRLYIYFGSDTSDQQQAFELSRHAPDYLPSSYWAVTVSSAHNSIFVVSGNSPGSEIFCYRNQVANQEIIQNAFFKFNLNGNVHAIKAIEDDLYIVKETDETSDRGKILQLQKMSLIPDDIDVARLDNRISTGISATYDASTDKSTFTVDGDIKAAGINQAIITSPTAMEGIIIDITTEDGILTAPGNYSGIISAVVGTKYNASITLSDIFLREEENNVIPGTLNLRYGIARHHKTGFYDISVTRKKRTANTYTFEPPIIGSAYSTAGDATINDTDGVFKFPIMGFTDDIDITIESSYPYPMNITNIEITGKFKRLPHFLTT